jgi:hypothetical protein
MMLPKLQILWTPVVGNVNYTTNGVTAAPDNPPAEKGAVADNGLRGGTPGVGDIRNGI